MHKIVNIYYGIFCIIVVYSVVYIYSPWRHARWYSYVKIENIVMEFEDIQYLENSNLNKCCYENIIKSNNEIISNVIKLQHFEIPLIGGEHFPTKCLSFKKSAILVPYRNRHSQLDIFLNYIHSFLQKQYISYRIFIIEQNNSFGFNRGKLLNVGALEAMRMNYSCFIMHDVDLLPLNSGNIYTCTKMPRHMSSALDVFRYNLPYEGLFGGAISIKAEQYKKINGMSNEYVGWGGEDDDFYRRLQFFNITPYRFSPKVSKYTMLKHKKAKPSKNRYEKLEKVLVRQSNDGLSSLASNYVVYLKPLYTHIVVP